MARLVRVGLIQTKANDTKQENIDKAVYFIEKAASQSVQVVCLQELFFSPYFMCLSSINWLKERISPNSII